MNITRRQFCRQMAATVATISAGSLFTACGGITRNDLSSNGKANGYIFGLDQRDEQILHYASLAPSILNSQPWLVRITDKRQWIIGIDQHRRLPFLDPDNREILLSVGAFIENLSIASAAQGLRADVQVIAQSPSDQDVARIVFTYKPPIEYPMERLKLRRTVKHGFKTKELTFETEQALGSFSKDSFFYFPKGTEHASCIQHGVIEQYRNQLNRTEAQHEIISWMRFSRNEALKCLDGLTLEGMEITGISGWYLRHFAQPPDFLKPGYQEKNFDYTAKLADEGAGWVIITSKGSDIASLVETGRCFERMALIAREHNVAIHPMSQYLEEKDGLKQIQESHVTNFIPQFLLRVGYIDTYPPPVSLRRPIHWFLQT